MAARYATGTREILPSGSWDVFPGRARLSIHQPVDVTPYSLENVRDLMQHVRTVIESGLDPDLRRS